MISALYYPFSRCINSDSLKQMLLLFESVSFLDPVSDDDWRAYLMEEMVFQEDKRFSKYRDLHKPIKALRKEGMIKIVNPDSLSDHSRKLTSLSAISDLVDESWSRIASKPAVFGMPHRNYAPDGSPTWQIFKSKLPNDFYRTLSENVEFQKHIVKYGDDYQSWTLSYEAGSAISISLHLSADEELELAPITDSVMHNHLLLRKSMRNQYGIKDASVPLSDTATQLLAHQTAISLIDDFLPKSILKEITIEDILKFREETKSYRNSFINDIKNRLSIVKSQMEPEHLGQLQKEVENDICKEVKNYQNEIANAKFKIWPELVSSFNKGLASGSIAAVALNMIGGAGYTLVGSILAASLIILKSSLDIKAEIEKTKRSASPSATFISKVTEI